MPEASLHVLISDPLPPDARGLLEETGHIRVTEQREGIEELLPVIHGWILRSGTRITADLLELATELRCICRAGAGVDNIDREAATRRGVVVMNTPDANSRAAAEHTIALLLALARNVPFAHATMAKGGWDKSAYVGVEVEGKHLGIVGLGKIGRIVARKARGLGMEVIGVDPFVSPEVAAGLGVELSTLEAMLPRVDFLALHTPLTDGTRGLINKESVARCRRGIRIINCSRGGVVDEAALLEALESGQVAGAALDVYAKEPPLESSPLRNHSSIVTTPHLGASTVEAQEKVATLSAQQVRDYLLSGTVVNAVNTASLAGDEWALREPVAHLAFRVGCLQGQLLDAQPRSITIEVEEPDASDAVERLLADHALAGFLQAGSEEPVNSVNARYLARERGIDVSVRRAGGGGSFTRSVRVDVAFEESTRRVDGAVVGRRTQRLVRVDEFPLDSALEGPLLITYSVDQPGTLGRIATFLGERGLNIASMSLGRDRVGGRALAVFQLDSEASAGFLRELGGVEGVTSARFVQLSEPERA
ncbi:MAG: phosphoglycerate dehydrogenase [Planctomycetota bacterium]